MRNVGVRIEAYISESGSLLWLFITLNQRRTLDMIGPMVQCLLYSCPFYPRLPLTCS